MTNIYLFKFSNINSRIKSKISLKLTIVPDVILVSLFLNLNIYLTQCPSVLFADFEHVNGGRNDTLLL